MNNRRTPTAVSGRGGDDLESEIQQLRVELVELRAQLQDVPSRLQALEHANAANTGKSEQLKWAAPLLFSLITSIISLLMSILKG